METPAGEDARRHDLDALRAAAMLLGIVLHGAMSFFPMPWPVQDTQQNGLFGLLFIAIHGFRMPLFFVVSGFFAALLWRKRGLPSLLRNRVLRILLPCLLGLITIIPLQQWIFARVMTTGSTTSSSQLMAAIGAHDLERVRTRITAGDDLEAVDPKLTMRPLSWAALNGDETVVRTLLNAGADARATTSDGTTPLGLAAFLGHADVVATLLAHGAPPDTKNVGGETPFDATLADWKTTQFIVQLVGLPPQDQKSVTTGRTRVQKLLDPERAAKIEKVTPSDKLPAASTIGSLQTAYSEFIAAPAWSIPLGGGREPLQLFMTPVFHHLWFLWFLCWLVPLLAAGAWLVQHFGWVAPRWWVLSPARMLWLWPLTLVPQAFMGIPVPGFGPDTSTGLIPLPHVLLYYSVFFGFGAMYFTCDDAAGRLGKWWWLTLPCALLLVFPLALVTMGAQPIGAIVQVLYTWLLTFGAIGLFRDLVRGESRIIRYISDSSYWLYLAHLPLIVLVQWWVRDWPIPAIAKFVLVCGLTTAVLLLSYHTCVRYTWLGTLLNGPRKRAVASEKSARTI